MTSQTSLTRYKMQGDFFEPKFWEKCILYVFGYAKYNFGITFFYILLMSVFSNDNENVGIKDINI